MDHWLLRAAAMHPERVAVATDREPVTYRELEVRARLAAGALLEGGVSSGDRVALALPPGAEFTAVLHGCFLVGAAAVPIDLRLGAAERAARAVGAAMIVSEAIDGLPLGEVEPVRRDAIATVMHTSGTTAGPCPVALTYGNWLASACGSAVAHGLDTRERWLCPLPLAHVGGLSIPIRSAIYGTTAVLRERFDASAVCKMLMEAEHAITLVSLVPTMLARLLDAGLREPPSLRWALLGGAPVPSVLLDLARKAGVPVAPTYGMTEACSQIATHGWPLLGVSLRIADDGEVLVSGATVADRALDSDGWLHTGDVGSLDERGRLTITGRKSETIISGGENVAPTEVEAVLLEHPAVLDAGVFGQPDPEWGEVVMAKVVLRDRQAATDADELRSFCASRMARFKVPKAFEFVAQLPRTDTGKLLRRALSERQG